MSSLQDRVAIVTGGAQGIGRTIAEKLGGLAVEVDVSDQAACERMAAAAMEAYGRIDVLVNNAGIYTSLVPTPFEELSIEEWKRVFDVNVLGMYLATRAVTPHMRAAPEDIVGAVAFFAGDGAASITGQALVVDGGAHFN